MTYYGPHCDMLLWHNMAHIMTYHDPHYDMILWHTMAHIMTYYDPLYDILLWHTMAHIMTHIMTCYHDILWPILWHRSVKCVVPSLTYWVDLTWWDKLTSCIFDKSVGHNSTGYLGRSCILRLYQSPVPLLYNSIQCYTIVYNAPETWSVFSG